jgi:hypothetical protein
MNVGITDMHQKMLGTCFEGYIVNKYGFANVPRSGFKYIHNDLVDPLKYLTITLTMLLNRLTIFLFACTLFLHIQSWILCKKKIWRSSEPWS